MQRRRRINREAHRPVYLQLADELRLMITSGEIQPGDLLPSEPSIGQQYDVGRVTVRRAVAVLQRERLVEIDQGIGIRVRESEVRTMVELNSGDGFIIRPATPQEQERLGLQPGDPVLEVTDAVGEQQVYPAYKVRGRVPGTG